MTTGTRWIVDGTVDPRWPLYTRANAGEVAPNVISPLDIDLFLESAELGFRDACYRIGLLAPQDRLRDELTLMNVFGGYVYLNLSLIRLLGVRAPGSSAEAIDATFLGEGEPPPYVPRRGDRNIRSTLRLTRSIVIALRQRDVPAEVAEIDALASANEASCPPLDGTDDELLHHLAEHRIAFRHVFADHIYVSSMSAIPSGVIVDACAAAGRSDLLTTVLGAAGDVRSADYARSLADIAGLVRSTPAVAAEFDAGIDGLHERLRRDPEAAAFNAAFDEFVDRHGHRGPSDWDIGARTWSSEPSLALVAVDRLRALDPAERTPVCDDERRQAAIATITSATSRADRPALRWALAALPAWTRAREATRDRAVKFIQPTRRVVCELERRYRQRSGIDQPRAMHMLRHDELRDALAEPRSVATTVSARLALREQFTRATPPFLVTSAADAPTLESMTAGSAPRPALAAVGDVLRGQAGSAGNASGTARVVRDPGDCAHLEPGDVLVCPITDPGWTPLFLAAAAVVVDTGALMSHAVVVSRELGIPCVTAVQAGTTRLCDGMTVVVDGNAGTVTVVAVP